MNILNNLRGYSISGLITHLEDDVRCPTFSVLAEVFHSEATKELLRRTGDVVMIKSALRTRWEEIGAAKLHSTVSNPHIGLKVLMDYLEYLYPHDSSPTK